MSMPETGIRIIPPVLFLVAFLLAWLVHWLWPLDFGLPGAVRWPLGILLIAAPLAAAPFLFAAFRRAGSEYDVRKIPKGLVTEGLFRYSRNPGYVGLIVLGIGVAVLFDNPWVLVALVPTTVVLYREVILKEEAILESQFGEDYLRYKRRVRRWL